MGDELEDFLEGVSRQLDEKYAAEKPQPSAEGGTAPQTEREMEARMELLARIAGGQAMSTALLMFEDDPHVQLFYCDNGHLMGGVTGIQSVIIAGAGGAALCIVCGLRRNTPRYELVGDEPDELAAALKAGWEKHDTSHEG